MPSVFLFYLAVGGALQTAAISGVQGTVQSEIVWVPCGDADANAECASIDLPLRYDQPDGRTIQVAVKRIAAATESRRQLWFLDGGPGDAGRASLERLAAALDDPYLDVYTADHRGVGGTALLTCPDQQAPDSPEGREVAGEEWIGCIEHIRATRTDLDALTVTATARDLGSLVEMVRVPGTPVFVMGASYGTFLANRYLQLFPDQPDGVILDGIVPPDWSFAEFDAGLDHTGRLLLRRCGDDDACAAHLTAEPEAFVEGVLDKLSEGHCGLLGITPELTRLLLGIGLMVDRMPIASIPALANRIDRCAWHDEMALLHLFRGVLDGLGEPESHSPVLQRHIAMSELWSADAPTTDALEAALEGYVMTTGVSASFSRTAADWPTYDPDPLDEMFADYGGPMLMLHGSMDPTMAVGRLSELRSVFAAANQTFVVVPDAGHVVLNVGECPQSIYRAFLDAPHMPPDTTCLASVPRISFAADDSVSVRLFGTPDIWGDDVGVVRTAVFHLAFRYQAFLIGIALPIVGVGTIRRRASESKQSVTRTPRGRAVAALGVCLFVVGGPRCHPVIVPLLLQYNAAPAVALVMTVAGLHVAVGSWLIRWIGRRS